MEDHGAAAPVTQVIAGGCLEWERMYCKRTNNIRSPLVQRLDLKVVHKTPDNVGMGSLPKVRPKDAKAH